ncbi:MAG: hypothetical protein JXR51_00005, partial [Bacteroidales bacterium]|nr:hypothetical protein [Bacteroidales bacterium]
NSIVQDSKGFIWLATETGLNRFDGYDFKVYKQEAWNKDSLISGYLRSLSVDKKDRIWIGSISGLNCYDTEYDKFHFFTFQKHEKNTLNGNFINSVFVDSEGFVWVGTQSGLNKSRIDIGNKPIIKDSNVEFENYKSGYNDNCVSNYDVKCFFEDKNNNIWIGTLNGLNKFDKKTGKIVQFFYTLPKNIFHDKFRIINAINQLDDSTLFIGTEGGLLTFNINSKNFNLFINEKFISKENLFAPVKSILKDSFGNFWFGISGKGLVYFDVKLQNNYLYQKENEYTNSLTDNFIISLFEDKSSTLFIGLYGKGLNTTKINPNKIEVFRHIENDETSLIQNVLKHSTCQDNKTIWLGTYSKGLEKFNPNTKKITHYPFKKLSRKGFLNSFQHVMVEDKDNLWIGTMESGLILFNHKTGNYKQYLKDETETSISCNSAFWLAKDKINNLWIGTFGNGLDKFDLKSGIFRNFNKNIDTQNSISNNFITFLGFDNDGILWLTTWGGGLNAFNTKTEKFTRYNYSIKDTNSISSDFCIVMHFDKDGIIWVGTSTGLNKFDKKTGKFKVYGKKEGLPDLFINSIEEDDSANLWISHIRGISKFNKKTEKFVNFTVKDGLQDNEFNSGVSTKLPDGRLLFGGISGFNLFHPDSLIQSKFKANINITNFKIFYNDVKISQKYDNKIILKKSITYTDTVELNYKNNVIGFEFAAFDYKNPQNIKYAFKLKGFESDWNYTDYENRYASYTNLEYGTYVLQIKSTNSDGVWSDKIKELVIIVNAPFWLTSWFKVLLIIAFVLIVIVISKVRTKVLKYQKIKLEHQVKERTKIIEEQSLILTERYEEVVSQKEELKQQAEELLLISELLENTNKELESKVKERTTELEFALEKAKDAEKLISSFLSNLSHEIRTPMNAILGFSQLICSFDISDEEKAKYIEIIEKNVDVLLNQIDNIMNVAKLHTGHYKLKNKKFDLNILFVENYNLLKSNSDLIKENVDFILELPQNTNPKVFSDEESIKHIVFNLVENALKYTETGYVKFGYKINNFNSETKKIEIFVSDTGIGIEDKSQKIIFKAFSKLENSTEKLYRGTGLGLALVRSLVEKLNGEIYLDSEKNKGTKINILIPLTTK